MTTEDILIAFFNAHIQQAVNGLKKVYNLKVPTKDENMGIHKHRSKKLLDGK